MNIIIGSIGKESENWQHEAIQFYAKRIGSFATLKEITHTAPKRLNRPIEAMRQQEHQLLTTTLPKQRYTIVLDERGKTLSSHQLAQLIDGATMHCSTIAFLLGGADGHAAITRQEADKVIALSAFTLPHILAKIMLYEQVYRSLSIIHQHPYHR